MLNLQYLTLLFTWVVAFGAALLVAYAGRRLGWLADGRAVAASATVGGLIFGFAGWPGVLLLLGFFVSSSLLSRLNKDTTPPPADLSFSKRRGRSARQVLANGGAAALAAVAAGLTDALWAKMALAGAIATATADTWATEIGTWWGDEPRSALTGRRLEPGESGGVTPAGTLAGMMGAAGIATAAYWALPGVGVREAVLIEAAGFLGLWCDSVLGASIQYKARCSRCGLVEDRSHAHIVSQVRGFAWCDNHVVNGVATCVGAAIAAYFAVK